MLRARSIVPDLLLLLIRLARPEDHGEGEEEEDDAAGDLERGQRDAEGAQEKVPAEQEPDQDGARDEDRAGRDHLAVLLLHRGGHHQEDGHRADRIDQHPHHHELVDDVLDIRAHQRSPPVRGRRGADLSFLCKRARTREAASGASHEDRLRKTGVNPIFDALIIPSRSTCSEWLPRRRLSRGESSMRLFRVSVASFLADQPAALAAVRRRRRQLAGPRRNPGAPRHLAGARRNPDPQGHRRGEGCRGDGLSQTDRGRGRCALRLRQRRPPPRCRGDRSSAARSSIAAAPASRTITIIGHTDATRIGRAQDRLSEAARWYEVNDDWLDLRRGQVLAGNRRGGCCSHGRSTPTGSTTRLCHRARDPLHAGRGRTASTSSTAISTAMARRPSDPRHPRFGRRLEPRNGRLCRRHCRRRGSAGNIEPPRAPRHLRGAPSVLKAMARPV